MYLLSRPAITGLYDVETSQFHDPPTALMGRERERDRFTRLFFFRVLSFFSRYLAPSSLAFFSSSLSRIVLEWGRERERFGATNGGTRLFPLSCKGEAEIFPSRGNVESERVRLPQFGRAPGPRRCATARVSEGERERKPFVRVMGKDLLYTAWIISKTNRNFVFFIVFLYIVKFQRSFPR